MDVNGAFACLVYIDPAGPGSHTLTAADASGQSASAPYTIRGLTVTFTGQGNGYVNMGGPGASVDCDSQLGHICVTGSSGIVGAGLDGQGRLIASPYDDGVPIPDTAITAGGKYWIAILAPRGAGTPRYRDVSSGGGRGSTTTQKNLTALPSAWSSGWNRSTNAP